MRWRPFSASRATSHEVARCNRGVPRPPAGLGGHPGRHVARGRHSAPPRRSRVRGGGPRRLPQIRGTQPDRFVQGSRHDGGGFEGARRGGQSGGVRFDRQHVGVRCGVCGSRRNPLHRGTSRRKDRSREAGSSRRSRSIDRARRWQLRRRPGAGARTHFRARGDAGQLDQPLPDRRSANGGVGGRFGTRRSPRGALAAGRQCGEHHRLLAGLCRSRASTTHVGLPGCGGGAHRARRGRRLSRDGGDRDPDRKPRILGRRGSRQRRVRWPDRSRIRCRDPERL